MAGSAYAQVSDITALGKALTASQTEAAEILLASASSKLRLTAAKYGRDLEQMLSDPVLGEDFAVAVKSVIVQAVCRALDSIANTSPAVTQESQTALGYSATMTYLNAGQSLYFLRNELKDLGILRQTFGALEVYQIAEPYQGG